MGILDLIRSLLVPQSGSPTLSTGETGRTPMPADIGTTKPVCPYCLSPFPKMPARKTKCPSCNNFVFSRTRPSDRRKVLLRVDDLECLEEQWSITNGTHDDFVKQRQRRLATREALHQQFGKLPSEFDVEWRLLNEDSITHASTGNWGLYRNTRFSMGESLRAEGRLKEALVMYLEVCYLDLNGPQNREGIENFPELAAKFPSFDPKDAFLAPGVLERCRKLASTLKLTPDNLRDHFQKAAEPHHRNLRLPVDPQSAWRRFEAEWVL